MTVGSMLLSAALSLAAPADAPSDPSVRTPSPTGVELGLSYYGPYFVQPGVKLGARVPLQTWASRRTTEGGTPRKLRTLFVTPQLGFFARPAQHFDLLLNLKFGYRALRPAHGLYVAPSLGFAYYAAFQQVALAVDLATGELTPTRELRHHLLPTLNYEFGQRLTPDAGPPLGWFVELSYGHDFSPSIASALWMAFEIGLFVELGTRRKGQAKGA